jgi:hypothetical protein
MRVVKSISLPVVLAEKAKEFDNLSLFVQDCILFGVENNLPLKIDTINRLKKHNFDLNDTLEELTDYLLQANNSKQLSSMRQKMIQLLTEKGFIE